MSEQKKKYNEIEVKDNMKVKEVEETGKASSERKEMTKIVNVEPTKVKRGLISRLVVGLVGPDGLPGIGSYVNDEIVKPAIKNIIVDAVTSGINMIMYGDSRHRHSGGSGSGSYPRGYQPPYRPTTNYSSQYRNHQPHSAPSHPQATNEVRSTRNRHGVTEYRLQYRDDAVNVLVQLTEAADMYDTVSVADYYDLIGVPTEYTDNQFGWTIDSITRATIVPSQGGYVIKFPPVEVI